MTRFIANDRVMALTAGDRIYDPLSERYGYLLEAIHGAVGHVKFDDQSESYVYLGGIQPARPALAYGPPRLVARDGVRVEGA